MPHDPILLYIAEQLYVCGRWWVDILFTVAHKGQVLKIILVSIDFRLWSVTPLCLMRRQYCLDVDKSKFGPRLEITF
jgi:hypothetical protein